jgi:NitT/TauT family transport system substrate-binding protein
VKRFSAARNALKAVVPAALVVLAAAWPAGRADADQAKYTLRIGTIPTEIAAAVYYAKDLGYFSRAGIDATISPLSNGAAVSSAVVSGAVDVGFSNPISLELAHDKGLPITVLAGAGMHDEKIPTDGLLSVLATSSIREAKDLNGKTIAVSGLGNITELGLRNWIDTHGGDSRTVHVVELRLPEMPAAVLAHRVDAATMDSAGVSSTKGAVRVLGSTFDSYAPRFVASCWFSSVTWVKQHPDAAKAFVGAIREASAWANTHHHDAMELWAKHSKYTVAQLETATPPLFATTVNPALLQPTIDVAAKYHFIRTAFPAKDLLNPLAD